MSGTFNLDNSLLRNKRKALPDCLFDILIAFGAHSEYDLETRLKPGQDAKIRVNAFPISPLHNRAQVSSTRTV